MGGRGLKINKDQVEDVPFLALFGSWTLDFRESNLFPPWTRNTRGNEGTTTKRISSDLVSVAG